MVFSFRKQNSELNNAYIHYGQEKFDTGLEINLLSKYILIALDVYHKNVYSKEKNELDGWMSLLVTENVAETDRLIKMYPWMEEIYTDMQEYIQRPEEVLSMFSEALRILDRNTAQYMIDELKNQADEERKKAESEKKRADEAEITKREMEQTLKDKNEEIKKLKEILAEMNYNK